MTIKQKLLAMLDDNGIFAQDAEEILKRYLDSEPGQSMRSRMNDNLEGYPPPLFTTVWMSVCRTTIEWMDAECPAHWARGLFKVGEGVQ